MVALQIRHVPDDVRDALAREAERRGQSLQAYLLGVLAEEARRADNPALLATLSGRDDGARDEVSAAQTLRRTREERTAHLIGESRPSTS